jgi:hypothetical protein
VMIRRVFLGFALLLMAVFPAGCAFFVQSQTANGITVEMSPKPSPSQECQITTSTTTTTPTGAPAKDAYIHVAWLARSERVTLKADVRDYNILFSGSSPFSVDPSPVTAGIPMTISISWGTWWACLGNTSLTSPTCNFTFTAADTHPDVNHSSQACDPTIHVTK